MNRAVGAGVKKLVVTIPAALPQAKVGDNAFGAERIEPSCSQGSRHSLTFSALPVRRKIFPLGQSWNTSHRLQSGLRA